MTTITGAAKITYSTVDDRVWVGATGRPLSISTFVVATMAIFPVQFLRDRRALRAKRFFAGSPPPYLRGGQKNDYSATAVTTAETL